MTNEPPNYVDVPVEWLDDSRLSWKAKGILYYLLIDLENLEERVIDLESGSDRDGYDSTMSGLKELQTLGYLEELGYSGALTRSNPEKRIRDRLHKRLGGAIEVATPVGRVDLLTDTEIIEVKPTKAWKSAMGQVLAYGAFYPSHQKRIHLFGSRKHANINEPAIQETLKALNIVVTFEGVGS